MSQPPVPQTFDWVTARSRCSIRAVYKALFETVSSDMKQIEAVTAGKGAIRYAVESASHDRFIATREVFGLGTASSTAVVFERLDNAINVKEAGPQGATLFVAKPHIVPVAPGGRCILSVDDKPMELWQVSQLAIERLLLD